MKEHIGLNIQKIRELKSIKQEFIAEKLGISQTAYSNIENGKTKINEVRLIEISSVLGVSPEVVRNFSEKIVFNSCSQSGIENTYNINSIEEIKSLFEKLLFEKDKRIQLLESLIKNNIKM